MILSLTFSQSFFEQNVSVQLKLLRFSAIFFKIKPDMRDVLAKIRECGKYAKMLDFPHDCGTVDLSMVTQVGSFILVYVECKVAIPMVSTRKTDDDHHVADSEAIGRLRHELIKSTGNPRISSGEKTNDHID